MARKTSLSTVAAAAALLFVRVIPTSCFVVTPSPDRMPFQRRHVVFLRMQQELRRRNVRLPLLDLEDSDYANKIVTPLPSAHLPTELTTLNLYGMELDRPVHKMLMEEAILGGDDAVGEVGGKERAYGHVVYKPNGGLEGAIGCAAEILINAPSDSVTTDKSSSVPESISGLTEEENGPPMTVLCRGSYRFVVKEIVKSFPYPIAIVDELVDDEPSAVRDTTDDVEENDEDEDDEDDFYADLDASELVQRTLTSLKTWVDQKLSESPDELSPLEKSILEDSGLPAGNENIQKTQAEEMAAVFDVFVASLIDICPMPVDRYYAIAMMAAEMTNADNNVRKKILSMRNGVERLRVVLRHVEEMVGMARARKMANSITNEADESDKDLKVGSPQLPPWASQIKEGTKLEYYWNEEYEWCKGVVTEPPVKVLDELIVTVRFDDGETHRLPFHADEKVRWRPAQ